MEFLREFLQFLMERKKFWLIPMILMLLLIGILFFVAESSTAGSFIYTLF